MPGHNYNKNKVRIGACRATHGLTGLTVAMAVYMTASQAGVTTHLTPNLKSDADSTYAAWPAQVPVWPATDAVRLAAMSGDGRKRESWPAHGVEDVRNRHWDAATITLHDSHTSIQPTSALDQESGYAALTGSAAAPDQANPTHGKDVAAADGMYELYTSIELALAHDDDSGYAAPSGSAITPAGRGPMHADPSASAVEGGFNPRPQLIEQSAYGLYPSIEIVMRHHENVFRRPAGEERSDTIVAVRPALLYRTNIGRHDLQLRYGTSIERHQEFPSEDTTDHGGSAVMNLDITERLNVDLFTEYQSNHEARGTSASRLPGPIDLLSGPDEFDLTRYGGDLTYGRRDSMFQLTAGAIGSDWRFTNNDQEGRDRDEDRIYATLYYNLSPRTSLFLRGVFDDIDFVSPASDLDNEETGYFFGARWEATVATSGEVGIGRVEKEFDAPARGTDETSSYFARIIWQPKPFSTVALHASKTFEETTELDSEFIESRLIGMNWDHALTDRWAFFLYVNETRDKFSDGRRDTLHNYGLGLDYAFRSWLTFGVSYGMFERDSNAAEAEFEDQTLSLYARLGLSFGTRGF